ncbi:glycosyltransferase family 2 protein [Nitrospirillum sp. BR 11163]|uniref:glycosyltransferase family 2 protein n=1 Tax=Nitrospirillum sp. BR 11163 TaxID=3104323 RepID=UPI002AFEA934|nr:glycosyltransferase [Nitrospirillum sp. BR 11163]MEA1672491.1 glycosyltransferase [Nitrospirillum sp. BR 11163]
METMNSNQSRISVVIPLYNHQHYIGAALEGVLGQTVPVHEIVIVDDGSRDQSAQVARDYAAGDARIVFWSKPNGGAHAAINDGIHRATGDLIAILNSDDIYHPDRFQRMLAPLQADPALDVVMTGLDFIDGRGGALANTWYEEAVAFHRTSGDLGLTLVNGNIFMTTSNLLIRRRAFDELGYFSALRYAHDLDFFLRVVGSGRTIHRVDAPLLSYRQHDTNTISEGHLKVKVEWAAVVAHYLHRLWRAPDAAAMDWQRTLPMLDLLDRHTLTRPVLLFLNYFDRHPSRTLENHPFFTDVAFRQFMNSVVA